MTDKAKSGRKVSPFEYVLCWKNSDNDFVPEYDGQRERCKTRKEAIARLRELAKDPKNYGFEIVWLTVV